MKLDNSISGPNWRNALLQIFRKTRKTLEPVIVVRGDIPSQTLKMQQFFVSMGAPFTRLGVTCSLADSLMELLHQVDSNARKEGPLNIDLVVQLILNCNIARGHRLLFVIDNCHYLMPNHLFYLLGLIMKLEKAVQFCFFFTDDNLKKWKSKHSKDRRARFFLNSIPLKYAL